MASTTATRDARELVRLIRGIPAKVNLIPFNPWPGAPYRCSPPERIRGVRRDRRRARAIPAPVRTPRGPDILAACGQLKTASVRQRRAGDRRLSHEALPRRAARHRSGCSTLLLAGGAAVAVWLLLPGAARAARADRAGGRPARGSRRGAGRAIRSTCSASPAAPTFTDVILALDRAGRDPRVKGLLAQLSGDGPGLAQTQELRAALARFRAQGKFAYAYADSFGEFGPGTRGYYLATAFEQIHLQPIGSLGLTGILIETPLAARPARQARRRCRAATSAARTRAPPTCSSRRELTPAHEEVAEVAGRLARPADPGRDRRRPRARARAGRAADRRRSLLRARGAAGGAGRPAELLGRGGRAGGAGGRASAASWSALADYAAGDRGGCPTMRR